MALLCRLLIVTSSTFVDCSDRTFSTDASICSRRSVAISLTLRAEDACAQDFHFIKDVVH